MSREITTHHDLFGPQPGTGVGGDFTFTPGLDWVVLTAFTASTKSFHFQRPSAKIMYAEYRVVWLPTEVHRVRVRWHYNNEQGMNFTDMGEIVPVPTGGPIPSALNITAAMQAAQQAGQYTHIGHSFKGDALTPLILYEAHMTINWRVGYFGA